MAQSLLKSAAAGAFAQAGLLSALTGNALAASGTSLSSAWRGFHTSTPTATRVTRARRGRELAVQHRTVDIPDDVSVEQKGTILKFTGPLGTNAMNLSKLDTQGVAGFRVDSSAIKLCGPDRAQLNTLTTLVKDKMVGVSQGYLVYLQLVGVGARASKSTMKVPKDPSAPR